MSPIRLADPSLVDAAARTSLERVWDAAASGRLPARNIPIRAIQGPLPVRVDTHRFLYITYNQGTGMTLLYIGLDITTSR